MQKKSEKLLLISGRRFGKSALQAQYFGEWQTNISDMYHRHLVLTTKLGKLLYE